MLGSLSRELVKQNWDVEYRRAMSAPQALREAQGRNRTLLTRNKRLAKHPGVYVINAQTMPEQIAELRQAFASGAPAAPLLPAAAAEPAPERTSVVAPNAAPTDQSRPVCPSCNEHLVKITREQARPSISFLIYQIHHEFGRCPKCKRVFWPGSIARALAAKPQSAPGQPARGRQGTERRRGFGRVFRRPARRNQNRPEASGPGQKS